MIKKKKIEKVSAKELITKRHLKEFHTKLSNYLNNHFKKDIGIINGATAGGNKTVLELKNEELKNKVNKTNKELENYKIILKEINDLKIKDLPLIKGVSGLKTKDLKGILKAAIKGLKAEEQYNTLLQTTKKIMLERDNLINENQKLKENIEKNKISLNNRIKEKNLFIKLKNEWKYQKNILEQVPDEIIEKIENNIIQNKNNDIGIEM